MKGFFVLLVLVAVCFAVASGDVPMWKRHAQEILRAENEQERQELRNIHHYESIYNRALTHKIIGLNIKGVELLVEIPGRDSSIDCADFINRVKSLVSIISLTTKSERAVYSAVILNSIYRHRFNPVYISDAQTQNDIIKLVETLKEWQADNCVFFSCR